MLIDVSKAFDCILHDLLVVKLAVTCFDYQSLQIIEISSINNKEQKLIMPSVVTLDFYMEFHKGQICVP